jgi:hypothetical protein
VIHDIKRHPLQRALPPRHTLRPKEARHIRDDLVVSLTKIIAAAEADGRTLMTNDELAIVQEKRVALLKALDPQFKVPTYTPGVPFVDAEVDSDGDTAVGDDGQPAVSKSVPRPVAHVEATASPAEDDE